MSTNYYFENKQSVKESEHHKKKLDALLEKFKVELMKIGCKEELIIDGLEDIRSSNSHDVKQIHIGKRSEGWVPVFKIQDEYHGIQDMKEWYEQNKDEWLIINEYNKILTWDELESELINWNKDNPKAGSHVKSKWGYHYTEIDGFEWCKVEFC